MKVGISEIEIRMSYINSLKGKRGIVKSIIGKVQTKFNVSIAEVDYHDRHKQAVLGVSYVSNDSARIHRVLENLASFIENNFDIELIDSYIEIL